MEKELKVFPTSRWPIVQNVLLFALSGTLLS
jgi:hypothetical protein